MAIPQRVITASIAVLIAGLSIAFFFRLAGRARAESRNTAVEICLDFDEAYDLAYENDYTFDNFLKRVKAIGVSSIALNEETLQSLTESGAATFYSNAEYNRLKLLDVFSPASDMKAPAIVAANRETAQAIKELLKERYHISAATVRSGRYTIVAPAFTATNKPTFWSENLPLGFSADKRALIERHGFKVVLRPRNVGDPAWLAGISTASVSALLWADKEVPGYPGKEGVVRELLKEKQLNFVNIEFSKYFGEQALISSVPERLVTGHSISARELNESFDQKGHVERWMRATRERGMRFLYFHFWQYRSLEDNMSYMRLLAHNLKEAGFTLAPAAAPSFPARRHQGLIKGIVFFIAVLFPLSGLYVALRLERYLARFFAVNALSLLGALFIAALFYDLYFMQKIVMPLSIKGCLLLPFIASVFLLYSRGEVQEFLERTVKVKYAAAAIVLLGLMGIMLARSGNFAGGILPFELDARQFLENILAVRPRTKEFLFGHPLLLLGFYFKKKHLVWLGMIAPVSIINTFLHAHSPVSVSLLRTFHGLWLGLIVGYAALFACSFILKIMNKDPRIA